MHFQIDEFVPKNRQDLVENSTSSLLSRLPEGSRMVAVHNCECIVRKFLQLEGEGAVRATIAVVDSRSISRKPL